MVLYKWHSSKPDVQFTKLYLGISQITIVQYIIMILVDIKYVYCDTNSFFVGCCNLIARRVQLGGA